MNTQKLIDGMRAWQDDETGEVGLPKFDSVEELAYFITRARNSFDESEMEILLDDIEGLF